MLGLKSKIFSDENIKNEEETRKIMRKFLDRDHPAKKKEKVVSIRQAITLQFMDYRKKGFRDEVRIFEYPANLSPRATGCLLFHLMLMLM